MKGIQPGGNSNNERDSTRGKYKLNGIQPGGKYKQ